MTSVLYHLPVVQILATNYANFFFPAKKAQTVETLTQHELDGVISNTVTGSKIKTQVQQTSKDWSPW